MTDLPKAVQNRFARCPACGDVIEFRIVPALQDELNCPWCEALLGVVKSSPILLVWKFDIDDIFSYECDYDNDLDYDNDGDSPSEQDEDQDG